MDRWSFPPRRLGGSTGARRHPRREPRIAPSVRPSQAYSTVAAFMDAEAGRRWRRRVPRAGLRRTRPRAPGALRVRVASPEIGGQSADACATDARVTGLRFDRSPAAGGEDSRSRRRRWRGHRKARPSLLNAPSRTGPVPFRVGLAGRHDPRRPGKLAVASQRSSAPGGAHVFRTPRFACILSLLACLDSISAAIVRREPSRCSTGSWPTTRRRPSATWPERRTACPISRAGVRAERRGSQLTAAPGGSNWTGAPERPSWSRARASLGSSPAER